MANFDSLSSILNAQIASGPYIQAWYGNISSTTTAANTTSGGTTGQRFEPTLTFPASFGGGITGAICTSAGCLSGLYSNPMNHIMAIEYLLGTLTVSGNSFTDGVAMPTKKIRSNGTTTTSTTGTPMPILYVASGLTATAPVVTITYTDQDGNTGNSCALTLPNNPLVGSCFLMKPHMASGDEGIRDVTNISISTGTAGSLKVFGLLPIHTSEGGVSIGHPQQSMPINNYLIEASDTISVTRWGISSSNTPVYSYLVATAETI